jgi:OmcA/MtrC family decaheme c-type cytochrome
VDFPADLRDCQKCHNPGTYQFPLKTTLGTTVNTQSVTTSGAPTVNNDPADDTKVTPAAATCSACHDSPRVRAHMLRKGASFETLQQNIDSGAVSEKCNTCHGPGKSKDVSRVHRVK